MDNSIDLSIQARENLDPMIALIEQSQPVFDSQTNTSDAITAWASNLATVTTELRTHDRDIADLLDNSGPAFGETTQLIERLQPTLPIVLANLVSIGDVALTYQPNIEQFLVLFPQVTAEAGATFLANRDSKQDYQGQYLSFNLNINLPPPCTTGVKLCQSDKQYAPLNNGNNWKGDPNATLSGQDIPQLPPHAPPPTPQPAPTPTAIALAPYDPATGDYTGPDGKIYTRSDLAQSSPEQTWQTMLIPPR